MTAEWEGTASNPRRVLLPAALLAAGLVLGIVAAPSEQRPEFSVLPGVPQGPAESILAELEPAGGSWATLGDGPLSQRQDPAMVWTGTDVLVWGGLSPGGTGLRDGAAYDPAKDRWRRLPPAPAAGRADAVVAWTGSEMLVWGGTGAGGVGDAGAAFDPIRGRWRRLPDGPLTARHDAEFAWTGTELVIWGGEDSSGEPLRDGARYAPATNRWRMLPPGPLDGRGDYRDVEMVAINDGVLLWASTGREAITVVYEAAADRWRDVWTPRFQPATHPTFLSIDGAVLAWGWANIGDHGPLAMKFTSNPDWWTTIAQPPSAPDAGRALLGSDGVAVSWSRAGAGAWYDALSDEWHRMTPPPQPVAAGWAEQVWADDRLFVWHAEARRGAPQRAVVWYPSSSWQALQHQPSPLVGEISAVWTGWLRDDQQVLLWGGSAADADGGAVYDPALDLWESMPPAPLGPRTRQAASWTGSELIIVGGRNGGVVRSDGAAYEPHSRSWRRLPRAPVRIAGDAAAFGGTHLYAAGRGEGGLRLARYDPDEDRWGLVPPPPVSEVGDDVAVWWTGRELWVWSVSDGTARGAAWDPVRTTWRRLPDLNRLSGRVSMAGGWRRLFVMDGTGTTASLGLGTEGWRTHPAGPRFGTPPALVWAGRHLVAYDANERRLAALDPRSAGWAELRPPPVPVAGGARLLWTGRHLLVLAGGGVALLGS